MPVPEQVYLTTVQRQTAALPTGPSRQFEAEVA